MDRTNHALAGLSMGGFVVLHTGMPHRDTFSELYVYNSGHTSEAGLKQFEENFAAILKDPGTNDLFRVPMYMAVGETDIALRNGQRVLALFNQNGLRRFWVRVPALTNGPTGGAISAGPRRSCLPIAPRSRFLTIL